VVLPTTGPGTGLTVRKPSYERTITVYIGIGALILIIILLILIF